MHSTNNRQSGFTAIAAIVITATMITVCGIGFIAYKHKNKDKNLVVTTEMVSPPTVRPMSASPVNDNSKHDDYFIIKELGIKIRLTDDLEGLTAHLYSPVTAVFSV